MVRTQILRIHLEGLLFTMQFATVIKQTKQDKITRRMTEHTGNVGCVVALEGYECDVNLADKEDNIPIILAARLNLEDVLVSLLDSSRTGKKHIFLLEFAFFEFAMQSWNRKMQKEELHSIGLASW